MNSRISSAHFYKCYRLYMNSCLCVLNAPLPGFTLWHHHCAAVCRCDVETETWKNNTPPSALVRYHGDTARCCYGYPVGVMSRSSCSLTECRLEQIIIPFFLVLIEFYWDLDVFMKMRFCYYHAVVIKMITLWYSGKCAQQKHYRLLLRKRL